MAAPPGGFAKASSELGPLPPWPVDTVPSLAPRKLGAPPSASVLSSSSPRPELSTDSRVVITTDFVSGTTLLPGDTLSGRVTVEFAPTGTKETARRTVSSVKVAFENFFSAQVLSEDTNSHTILGQRYTSTTVTTHKRGVVLHAASLELLPRGEAVIVESGGFYSSFPFALKIPAGALPSFYPHNKHSRPTLEKGKEGACITSSVTATLTMLHEPPVAAPREGSYEALLAQQGLTACEYLTLGAPPRLCDAYLTIGEPERSISWGEPLLKEVRAPGVTLGPCCFGSVHDFELSVALHSRTVLASSDRLARSLPFRFAARAANIDAPRGVAPGSHVNPLVQVFDAKAAVRLCVYRCEKVLLSHAQISGEGCMPDVEKLKRTLLVSELLRPGADPLQWALGAFSASSKLWPPSVSLRVADPLIVLSNSYELVLESDFGSPCGSSLSYPLVELCVTNNPLALALTPTPSVGGSMTLPRVTVPPPLVPPVLARDANALMLSAALEGSLDALRRALASGADATRVRTDLGLSALALAAKGGHADACSLLINAGADVAAEVGTTGITALLLAASSGHAAAVRVLIAGGANVEARTAEAGSTLLMLAANDGHLAVVQELLRAGADVSSGATNDGASASQGSVVALAS